jgi:hypothetical protein
MPSRFCIVKNRKICIQDKCCAESAFYWKKSGLSNIKSGTARIEVLDALGKQVYEGEVNSQGMKTQQQLDSAMWPRAFTPCACRPVMDRNT